jgi:hypothetical protein
VRLCAQKAAHKRPPKGRIESPRLAGSAVFGLKRVDAHACSRKKQQIDRVQERLELVNHHVNNPICRRQTGGRHLVLKTVVSLNSCGVVHNFARRDAPVVMLYGTNRIEEIAYWELFDQAERELGLRTVYAVAEGGGPRLKFLSRLYRWGAHSARNTRLQRPFYISGPRIMEARFQPLLKDLGLLDQNEFFPGLCLKMAAFTVPSAREAILVRSRVVPRTAIADDGTVRTRQSPPRKATANRAIVEWRWRSFASA